MMKKFLFVAAAVVASMVFTGCINEDDTYKKLQPVEKGINIYNWTSSQYSMATEQANIGLRMAMLVAEAHKQGVDNFEDVKIEGISIKGKLLGTSSKIEKTTTGYKITFNPAYMDMDGYSREGAVLIDTGGAPLLEDAVDGKVWSVTFDEKLVLVATNGNTSVKASLVGGSTQLYNDENGAYAISIANQACYLDSGSNFTSNWGGRMTLKPHNMNFTYSDCMGEKFVVNTTGAIYGPSFYTMDNATSLELSMTLTDVEYYTRSSIREGKFEAMMTGGDDFTAFPSPKVTVKYAVSADGKKLLTTIEYAGNTVTI